ncbi:MAG TPA: hypothetical protein VFN79_18020 [Steroidobacteraceae bacterium]|nr:hypothetical protein [Steroidobacteraceae bacterium]
MATVETTLGMSRCNPWNLKQFHIPWLGESATDAQVADGGELSFITMDLGIRAGIKLCYTYQARGWNSPVAFITRFSPPPENPTTQYIQNVSTWTGFRWDASLDFHDPKILIPWARAIWRQEQGAAAQVILTSDILAAKAMADGEGAPDGEGTP